MKFSDEEKKSIITGFLDTLAGVANKEFQRRIWIERLGPEEDSFEDTCNDLDCDAIIEDYKELGISETQCELLVKFREVFSIFSKKNDWPPFFIDTPEWTMITQMAEEVLRAFNYRERGK